MAIPGTVSSRLAAQNSPPQLPQTSLKRPLRRIDSRGA